MSNVQLLLLIKANSENNFNKKKLIELLQKKCYLSVSIKQYIHSVNLKIK